MIVFFLKIFSVNPRQRFEKKSRKKGGKKF